MFGWFGPSNAELLEELKWLRAEHKALRSELVPRLDRALRLLKIVRTRLFRPGSLSIYAIREDLMAIQFGVALPAVSQGSDVVKRELTVTIPGKEPIVRELDKTVEKHEAPEYVGPQDSTVEVALVDIDDAGNRSEPSFNSFVLLDTIAPGAPGLANGYVTGEVADEPAPEAPAEPETPSEPAPESEV